MKNIRIELDKVKKELEAVDREFKRLPDGFLTKKGTSYYQVIGKQTATITKNHLLIRQLYRKRYLFNYRKQLQHNIATLTKAVKKLDTQTPKQIIANLPKTYQNLPLINFYHSSVEAWLDQPYSKNTYPIKGAGYTTKGGVTVRSKSEWIIATALEANNIPYRYDALIKLGPRTKSPDFTIFHPYTGKIIYWEHFGALHEPSYEAEMNEKMELYYNNGYIEGDNLIYTFEAHIRDPQCLQQIIDDLLTQ